MDPANLQVTWVPIRINFNTSKEDNKVEMVKNVTSMIWNIQSEITTHAKKQKKK
jgi:hypothetical protein